MILLPCRRNSTSSARARGPAFVEELLAGYGGPGLDDLEPFLEAHALYEAVWRARR